MSFTKQYWALLRMNFGGLRLRLGLVFTIMIGVACAVGVLVSMLAMGVGARREAMGNMRSDRAILMTVGAQGPFQSSISKDVVPIIRDLPGIRRNAKGDPIAISQVLVFVQARNRATGKRNRLRFGWRHPGLADYMPELHLTAGRMFRPGLHELIASNVCVRHIC